MSWNRHLMGAAGCAPDDDFVLLPDPPRTSQDEFPEIFRLLLCNGYDLYEASIDQLQHLFSSGALSAAHYVQFCLDRVQKINPYLECVIETNPDALEHANAMDEERKLGRVRGPPWDAGPGQRREWQSSSLPRRAIHQHSSRRQNMATADKMQTTGGSWALLGAVVPKDAHIVYLLRTAGAVILGKTNLDEWAGMRGSIYSLGYSPRGGQCRNPYRLNRSPNGSSSGSAVAVSSNIVPLAFGTETDCSIISPGAVNGVVGIKPTVGLTSRAGVIPISEGQDSIGPFGRCVADAARALDVIAGPDAEDPFSTQPGRRQPRSYCDFLTDRHALRGARFGLPMKRFWDVAPRPQRLMAEKALQLIKEAGAEIIPVDMPCAEERLGTDGVWDWECYGETCPEVSEITVCKVQTYYLMKAYLGKLKNTPIKTLEDIVRFNDENRGSEGGHAGDLPAFPDGQRLFRKCVETKGVKDETYYAALKHIQTQCRQYGIDAALGWPRNSRLTTDSDGAADGEALDALLFCDVKAWGFQIAAQAGYPVVTIPVGLDPDGMPVPLTLQHSAWQEEKLVKWASAIEHLLETHDADAHGIPSAQSGGLGRLGRVPPTYRNHLRKNIPVDLDYQWPGRSQNQGLQDCAGAGDSQCITTVARK